MPGARVNVNALIRRTKEVEARAVIVERVITGKDMEVAVVRIRWIENGKRDAIVYDARVQYPVRRDVGTRINDSESALRNE